MIKPPVQRIYEFEDFRLDALHLILYRGGGEILLAPKAVQTLLVLIEQHGEILGKDELMQRIWSDSIVEEANLTQYIYILRKILGTTADGRPLIETFRRRGYRFNGDVRRLNAPNAKFEISAPSNFNGKLFTSADSDENGNSDRLSENVPPIVKKSRRILSKMIAPAAFSGLLILAVSAFWNSKNNQSSIVRNSPNVTLKRLTPDQNAIQPTLSPDGKYMIYATLEKNTDKTLRLRDLTTGSDVQIMPDNNRQYMDFAFSSDGRQIYYLTTEQDSPNNTLERIPLLGGKPQEILKNVTSPPAVSPDGKRIAVLSGTARLIVVDEAGEPVYSSDSLKAQFNPLVWSSQMSWSPDGERLAICGKDNDGRARILDFLVSEQTGGYLPMPDFNSIDDAVWLADGSGLLITAKEKAGEPYQIWRVAYPSGKAVRVTRDFNDYDWISLSNDSKTLVVGQSIIKSNVWSKSSVDIEDARQLTFGSEAQDGYWGTAFAPDGKIIFTSPRSGNVDLWEMNADGSEQQPLTSGEGGFNIAPHVTNDGSYIVFSSTRGGDALHLWRINADGRNALQLTNGNKNDERFFDISQDGKLIYYATANEQKQMITRKVSINGGESSDIADNYRTSGTIVSSPDGKQLLRYIYLDNQEQPWRYGIFPPEGGEPVKLISIPAYRNLVRWAADGKSLLYIKSGTAQIWRQPIDGQPPVMQLDLRNGWLFYFALSPDYKQIVFAQGNQFSEAVLIENFGN